MLRHGHQGHKPFSDRSADPDRETVTPPGAAQAAPHWGMPRGDEPLAMLSRACCIIQSRWSKAFPSAVTRSMDGARLVRAAGERSIDNACTRSLLPWRYGSYALRPSPAYIWTSVKFVATASRRLSTLALIAGSLIVVISSCHALMCASDSSFIANARHFASDPAFSS